MSSRFGNGRERVSFVYDMENGMRVRVQLWLQRRSTARFAVTLEYEWTVDDWRRVVCIDNWGGSVHRDRYRPDGSDLAHHEPIFHSGDLDQAVAWAQDHFATFGRSYVGAFIDHDT